MEHPRVCGENPRTLPARVPRPGTSPRMRGKPEAFDYLGGDGRNIPAYAGKTPTVRHATPVVEEHPRVCGENGADSVFQGSSIGTSPRMRGKHLHAEGVAYAFRNIPAYAGKTHSARCYPWSTREHPRVCGENLPFPKRWVINIGTSPRMRGKRCVMTT